MEVINLKGRDAAEVKGAIEAGEVVYIGNNMSWVKKWYFLKGSKWGNPYKEGRDGTRQEILIKYREHITNSPELLADLHELKGKKLACWCKPLGCHGDILKELVQEG